MTVCTSGCCKIAAAVGQLIQKEGGVVAGFAFVIELSFLKGREMLCQACGIEAQNAVSIVSYE